MGRKTKDVDVLWRAIKRLYCDLHDATGDPRAPTAAAGPRLYRLPSHLVESRFNRWLTEDRRRDQAFAARPEDYYEVGPRGDIPSEETPESATTAVPSMDDHWNAMMRLYDDLQKATTTGPRFRTHEVVSETTNNGLTLTVQVSFKQAGFTLSDDVKRTIRGATSNIIEHVATRDLVMNGPIHISDISFNRYGDVSIKIRAECG